ncbi:uncharacterized protein [Littorina saxatilis]|uniref:uncharacterized protein isoform X2 n=1 Tax=Littorina saxatilis TaxID=31220 RepID=UPI0038B62789
MIDCITTPLPYFMSFFAFYRTAVETEVHENSAVTDDSANDASAKSQYASLQMSEVGLRSVYSDFAHRSTATQAQPGQPGDYASLQMSDVGMTSTYSELGQHDGVAPAHGGTDYEIPP